MKRFIFLIIAVMSSAILSAKEAEILAQNTITEVIFYSPEIVRIVKKETPEEALW